MGPGAHPPQGNPVANFLLLHGFLGQPGQWRWFEEVLRGRGHTARALALPGGTWPDEVSFVHRAVSGEGGPTHLVGHSQGGALVRSFATLHPDEAAGLATIAAPPPGFRAGWLADVGRFDDDRRFRPDVAAFLALAFPGCPPELAALSWEHSPVRGEQPEGPVTGSEPRLAIVCEDDAVVPYADQQRAAALLGAPTASVPGGHSPHVRHPALVATLIINWLAPEAA